MFINKSRRMAWVLAIGLSLSGLIFFSRSTVWAQRCNPAVQQCPPPVNTGQGGPAQPSNNDGRLNGSLGDPYVIYCVAGQLQIYKVDSQSRGNLLLSRPLSELSALSANGAPEALGQGFSLQRSGDSLGLLGPGQFFLPFGYNDCLQRAGVPLPRQADMNCDGIPDIIEVGTPGLPPFVRVSDGKTHAILLYFFAYGASFRGGLNFGLGNFTGDCVPDIVTGPGTGGGPDVKVFDGKTGAVLKEFFAYAPSSTGGVRVAVGDVNGDGYPDIVTGAGPGGGPHVKVFNGKTLATLASFFAFDPLFTGGVLPAVQDVNGDGHGDIIVKAYLPNLVETKVFDGQTLKVLSDTMS
jgi:hypothetical protein